MSPLCKQMFFTNTNLVTGGAVNVKLSKNRWNKCSLLPYRPLLFSLHVPITVWVELVLSLRLARPVTPGLILLLNYLSFANDVARLQSACLNMYGDSTERTGFMEMRIHRRHRRLHVQHGWPCPQCIRWQCFWVYSTCVCLYVYSNLPFSRPSFGHYVHECRVCMALLIIALLWYAKQALSCTWHTDTHFSSAADFSL